jgi:hypothetical protein
MPKTSVDDRCGLCAPARPIFGKRVPVDLWTEWADDDR